jgi:hypothetical protein
MKNRNGRKNGREGVGEKARAGNELAENNRWEGVGRKERAGKIWRETIGGNNSVGNNWWHWRE